MYTCVCLCLSCLCVCACFCVYIFMYICGDWACICVFVLIYKSVGVYDSFSVLFVGMCGGLCGYLHVCVCLCAHLWPMCMTVNLSDCPCVCVCVCVFPPPCPMLQKLSMQPQTGFPLWSFTAQARLFATWPDARLHQWQLSCFLCWHSITPETLTGVLRKCIYLLTAQNDPLQPENEIQAEWYLLQGILISHQLFS